MDNTPKPQTEEETSSTFSAPPQVPETHTFQQSSNHLSEAAGSEPRNFLVTFLLASYGGILGLRHFYLGQKALGFVRLGIFLGYFALLLLGAAASSGVVMMLGLLAGLVAYVWAIVDFFVVYLSVKTDAEGQELVRTKRDSLWAKVIFTVTIALVVLIFIMGILMSLFAESSFKKLLNSDSTRSNSTLELNSNPNSSLDDYRFDFESNRNQFDY